jgi:hypothetical protein
VDRDGHARPSFSTVTVVAAAWLGCCVACVDTGRSEAPDASAAPDAAQPATCAPTPAAPYSGNAVIPTEDPAVGGPYVWKNVVIRGGGFVSGIVMSPVLPGLAFARTDVGGAYRFDPTNQRWMPITDWVGHDNSNLTGIESIAADPIDPNRVYMAAGEYLTAGNGSILSSTDMGQTWTPNEISAPMGGNVDGRSMGERLAIDPNLPSILYFGSRNAGLWKSTDSAQTWTQVSSFIDPMTGLLNCGTTNGCVAVGNNSSGTGYGLTFVVFDPQSGAPGSPTPAIYVGVGMIAGTALYRSTDAGATWEAVVGQPPAGMMPHHAVLDGCGNLYLAYNNGSGPNGVTAGAVWRYATASGVWTNVSPANGAFGFGGISADAAHPGTMVVTTIDDWSPGEIYRTTDGGASWVALVRAAKWDVAGAQWLYWHTTSLPAMGWMGNVEIDPFNPSRALFITGQGLWSSDDVTAADSGAATNWTFADAGLEETVALDLASPPSGAPLLSGVGDIGGFKHDDLDVSPAAGMFANPIFGNTASFDFAESAPLIVARVGTNSGSTGVPGAFSTDGGTTWTRFAGSPAKTGTGSTAPSSGSIAVSADGNTFVWAPKSGTPSFSSDKGATWTACIGLAVGVRVAADRVNPSKFYASSRSAIYASTDGGATFVQVTVPPSIASTMYGRPRPVFGIEGDVWVTTTATTGPSLLHTQDSGASWVAIPQVIGGATAVGFGMAAPGAAYPAVYLAGSVSSAMLPDVGSAVWGVFRSDDMGTTWQPIDDPQHQFGYINCLTGDQNTVGRIYLGTSGRGIVYGDPRPQ